MRNRVLALALTGAALATQALPATGQDYFPGINLDWERRAPADAGFDAARLQSAVDFARAAESTSPADLSFNHHMTFGREPHGEAIGPFTVRAEQSGLIIHKGYIVAEWGDPEKVDNTFSVAKSFLSTTVGLAWDRGLIGSVDDRVRAYMPPIVLDPNDGEPGDEEGRRPKLLFESENNRKITWDHLLRQTSDWEGTLWGKPEWADRPDQDRSTWGTRARHEPGTVYEYNDTRVNLLALAATSVWRRSLPEVLRDHVMDPIGASPTWRWHGYENSWFILDGTMVQAVSGGSHWGGGMLINAFDLARFGLLTMHKGVWAGERIISEEWIDLSLTPGEVNEGYGFMNFMLNGGQRRYANAPEYTWTHSGAGSNLVYVDPANELVIVARWIRGNQFNDFLGMVFDAMENAATSN
ncbi:MAG: serine hydrolase [Gemmatimonadota bacterium]